MINFLQKHKAVVKIASIVAIFLGLIFLFLSLRDGSERTQEEESFTAQVETISAEDFSQANGKISATGQVKSLEQVDLKSQVSANVRNVRASLGDPVNAGEVLIVFENTEARAQLLRAEAGLESAQAQLDRLKKGAKSEELQAAETNVANAERSLAEAERTLENTISTAETNLRSSYASAVNVMISAAESIKNSLLSVTEIQYNYFLGSDQTSLRIKSKKAETMKKLFDIDSAGAWISQYISEADSGLYRYVNELEVVESNYDEIDSVLSDMETVLAVAKETLNSVPLSGKLSDTEQSDMIAKISEINGQISSVSSSRSAISVQESANQSSISGARAGLVSAENGLKSAKDQLALAKSGATEEELAGQEAQVKSALAGFYQAQAQFNKTVIKAPISGRVSNLSAVAGELISPGQTVVSLVNSSALEVEIYLDPKDALKVNIGDKVVLEKNIQGEVIRISPSINPSTKKVEINAVVNTEQKSALLAGQFVNLEIFVSSKAKENIYVLPLGAVKTKPNGASVFMVNADNTLEEKEVVLGEIIGNQIEVLSGINDQMTLAASAAGLKSGEKIEPLQ